ncbi:ABC transporter ATP-binding protein [Methylobacterium sp. Leaf100]|uniref:ABC transporter ATP-binding protein n=1 Tax=Methylobacterium sp. Leaf100 TaxID=1736252 RepID=UPI0009E74646|nr:ABC transporter ATP-binding protein [Methylobacterium sp. Leaf100]
MTFAATRSDLALLEREPARPVAHGTRAISPPQARPEPDPSPLLRLAGVTLEYRTPERVVRATHRIDLDVYEADRFVLLGPSGCGKSTLLKAAAGFIRPVEGEITLDGVPVREPGPDRIVVFQEFDQLPPWKTVAQNVAFPLRATRLLSRREAGERARHYIDKVGLSRFADSYPHQLSGGMKQRVAIARALAMQPKVLMMDEPFAALDALTRRRMQEELLSLWDEARFTLLFVTHSIEEALVVGNRVALLSPHPGRVRGEFNSHAFDLGSLGSREFQSAVQGLHARLFETDPASAPAVA